ncbi:MAG: serine/threonine-protein kinase [Phycisphaerae bacterium]
MPVPNDPQRDADARPAGPPPALRGEPGALGEVDALASGAGLGKYRILERMHATRQATLYKARDVMLDRLAAIKQLAPDLIDDPRACGRFRKEAYTLAQISHDARYVVGVYELIEQPRGLFLVMEYVPGYSLETLITKRQLSLQGTLELLARSCLGLRSVHAAGFIHRDLSPRHIITDPRCRPRIADFSMAMNAGAEPDYTVGSPAYTAPEIYLEQPFDDCIDIYSLGVIAYEMLIGRTEFSRLTQRTIGAIDDPIRWLAWHADPDSSWPAASELNPRVPPMLSEIVARMMARQRDERFSNIDDVLTMLVRHFSRAPRRVLTGVPAGLVAGTLPGAAVAPMPAAAVGEPRRIVDVTILPPAAGVFEPGLPRRAGCRSAPAAPIARRPPPCRVRRRRSRRRRCSSRWPRRSPRRRFRRSTSRVAASSPAPSPAVTPRLLRRPRRCSPAPCGRKLRAATRRLAAGWPCARPRRRWRAAGW